MQPIEIFRPGRHTDMGGATIAFTDADLAAMAAAYDPALHEAPIVVGHPATDGPAYGWVSGLDVVDGRLRASARQVDVAFAELVREGRYQKVSASFYRPDAATNPKPGVWYLRHVGFLGAQPPAVKGLRPVQFAAADDGVVEFADGLSLSLVARLFRGLRDLMIGQVGQERADAALPADQIEMLAEQAAMDRVREAPAPSPAYTEPQEMPRVATTEDDAARARREQEEARVAGMEAELARLRGQAAAFAEREAHARAAEDAAFLERLLAEGRLLPANAPLAAGLLARLDAGDAVAFAEGRPAETQRDALRALLAAAPTVVTYGEVAGAGGVFALPAGASGEEIAAAAASFQEAQKARGNLVSTIEAVRAVTGGQS